MTYSTKHVTVTAAASRVDRVHRILMHFLLSLSLSLSLSLYFSLSTAGGKKQRLPQRTPTQYPMVSLDCHGHWLSGSVTALPKVGAKRVENAHTLGCGEIGTSRQPPVKGTKLPFHFWCWCVHVHPIFSPLLTCCARFNALIVLCGCLRVQWDNIWLRRKYRRVPIPHPAPVPTSDTAGLHASVPFLSPFRAFLRVLSVG